MAQKTYQQHKKRAIIGGAVALTGVGGPVGIGYGGYHLYKMSSAPGNPNHAAPKPGTHAAKKYGSRQPVKARGRVG